MGEAAHDLRDRAAVHTEVMGRLALAPAEFENGIEDVAGGKMVAGKLGHSRSLTPFGRIEGNRLERDDQKCDSRACGAVAFGRCPSRIAIGVMVLASAGVSAPAEAVTLF